MSVPMVPNRMLDRANIDLDAINGNLLGIERDIDRNLARRYTRSLAKLDLAGVHDTSAQVLRELAIRRPQVAVPIEIISVECVVYTSVVVNATITCSDTTFPAFTFATIADVTQESYGSSGQAVQLPISLADVLFTLSLDGAATITDGYLIVHFRADRGQMAPYDAYVPTLFNSASSTAAATLQAEIDAIAAAVTEEAANQFDVRCSIVSARNLAPGASVLRRIPAGPGGDVPFRVEVYVVAAATATGTASILSKTGGSTVAVPVVGAGIAARTVVDRALNRDGGTDPTNSNDDMQITLSAAGAANVLLIYAVIWWF